MVHLHPITSSEDKMPQNELASNALFNKIKQSVEIASKSDECEVELEVQSATIDPKIAPLYQMVGSLIQKIEENEKERKEQEEAKRKEKELRRAEKDRRNAEKEHQKAEKAAAKLKKDEEKERRREERKAQKAEEKAARKAEKEAANESGYESEGGFSSKRPPPADLTPENPKRFNDNDTPPQNEILESPKPIYSEEQLLGLLFDLGDSAPFVAHNWWQCVLCDMVLCSKQSLLGHLESRKHFHIDFKWIDECVTEPEMKDSLCIFPEIKKKSKLIAANPLPGVRFMTLEDCPKDLKQLISKWTDDYSQIRKHIFKCACTSVDHFLFEIHCESMRNAANKFLQSDYFINEIKPIIDHEMKKKKNGFARVGSSSNYAVRFYNLRGEYEDGDILLLFRTNHRFLGMIAEAAIRQYICLNYGNGILEACVLENFLFRQWFDATRDEFFVYLFFGEIDDKTPEKWKKTQHIFDLNKNDPLVKLQVEKIKEMCNI